MTGIVPGGVNLTQLRNRSASEGGLVVDFELLVSHAQRREVFALETAFRGRTQHRVGSLLLAASQPPLLLLQQFVHPLLSQHFVVVVAHLKCFYFVIGLKLINCLLL